MFKTYFLILLCGHLLGDFYLQSPNLANNKVTNKIGKSILYNFLHAFVVAISSSVFFLPILKREYLTILFYILCSHLLIDFGKCLLAKKVSKRNKRGEIPLFVCDQLLHIFVMLFAANLLCIAIPKIELVSFARTIERTIQVNFYNCLLLITVVLLNGKPFNVLLKKCFFKYKPDDKSQPKEGSTINGAGSIIGFIERLLIAILYYNNQFSVIGLVITAKSVARYKRIEKEPMFAEYYLMGTLSSTLFAIVTILFINWVK